MFEARYTIVAETVTRAQQAVLRMKALSEGVKEQAQRAHDASEELQDSESVAHNADLSDILGLESVAPPHSALAEERANSRVSGDFNRFAQRVEQVRSLFESLRWLVHSMELTSASDRISAARVKDGSARLAELYSCMMSAWNSGLLALRIADDAVACARLARGVAEMKGLCRTRTSARLKFLRAVAS